MTPFKKPFKGKGALRTERRELEAEVEAIRTEMRALVEQLYQVFRKPRIMVLRLHQTSTGERLRWRTQASTGHGHRFIDLFGSQEGLEILRRCPPAARGVLEEFEERRIELNLRLVTALRRIKTADEYLRACANLEAYRKSHSGVAV